MSKKGKIRASKYNVPKEEWERLLASENYLKTLSITQDRVCKLEEVVDDYYDVVFGSFRVRPELQTRSCKHEVDVFISSEESDTQLIEFDRTFSRFLYHSSEAFFGSFPVLDITKAPQNTNRESRIQEISEELRGLRREFRKSNDKELLLKIKNLVQELNQILNYFRTEQRKIVRRLRKVLHGCCIRDIRRIVRQTVRTFIKYISEFSDDEEGARFSRIVDYKPGFYSNQKQHELSKRIFTTSAGIPFGLGR